MPISKANLKLYPLAITLTSDFREYTQDHRIEFKMKFINNSQTKNIPVYLPHPENGSVKTIFLRCFRLVNRKTTNEQYESKDISLQGWANYRGQKLIWLAPGDSLNLTICINDSLNYLHSTNAHHAFKNPILPDDILSDSVYFNVIYDPSSVKESYSYFNFENSTEDESPQELIAIPSNGCMSSYLLLKINQNFTSYLNSNYGYYDSIAHSINLTKNTFANCLPACSFCKQVKNHEWNSVEHEIEKRVEGNCHESDKKCSVIDWLLAHKCIAYAYPVGTILASLPSYGSIGVGFLTAEGLQDMEGSIRFGTIYKTRSRINHLFYLIGFRNGAMKSSDAQTVTFLSLIPVDSCTKVQGYEHTIKARMNWLEEQLQYKSLSIPPRDYFTAYFGISQEDLSFIDHHLEQDPEAYLQHCIQTKNDMGLCFLLPYPNKELQKKTLEALTNLNSRKCIPYLIQLSKKTTGNTELDQQIAFSILTLCKKQI